MSKHTHYHRDVYGLKRIDVYRILELFGVTCPVAQHIVKKALVAGQRGHKSARRDWQDIADSAARKLEMIDEDVAVIMAACGANGANELTSNLEPALLANVAELQAAGEWPDETRRQDAAAEDEAWKAVEARMDAIGQNGNDGEHYDRCQGCASCECRP